IDEHEGSERRVEVEAGRTAGKHVIAELKGADDRDAARQWIGAELSVERAALPQGEPGEYYWVDLEGLTVRNLAGDTLRAGDHENAKLKGVDDRDEARQWIGAELSVERAALPPCEPGEYYWVDLEGLTVRNLRGEALGEVDHMMQTGANDVLVLTGGADRLI